MYSSAVAGNIKRIIKEKCLSQGSIGKKAGYDIKKFSNMLNGRKIITDVDVLKISIALDVEPNILFGFEEEPEQKEVV